MHAEIQIRFRPDILDPQGQAVARALKNGGHEIVDSVRVGKLIDLKLRDGISQQEALSQIHEMCQALLANPVMEDYTISIVEEKCAQTEM